MGLLDKIKNVFGVGNDAAVEDEFTNIITSTLNEYRSKNKFFWSPVINETSVWTEQVKNWPDKKKISFIHFNHTNPLLDENSAELNDVLTKGFMVSRQAELIILK